MYRDGLNVIYIFHKIRLCTGLIHLNKRSADLFTSGTIILMLLNLTFEKKKIKFFDIIFVGRDSKCTAIYYVRLS